MVVGNTLSKSMPSPDFKSFSSCRINSIRLSAQRVEPLYAEWKHWLWFAWRAIVDLNLYTKLNSSWNRGFSMTRVKWKEKKKKISANLRKTRWDVHLPKKCACDADIEWRFMRLLGVAAKSDFDKLSHRVCVCVHVCIVYVYASSRKSLRLFTNGLTIQQNIPDFRVTFPFKGTFKLY